MEGDANIVNGYFLLPTEERPDEDRVRRRERYPRFDLSHVQRCVETLDGAVWDDDTKRLYGRRLKWYECMTDWPAYLTLATLVASYFLLRQKSVSIEVDRLSVALGQYLDRLPVPVGVGIFSLGTLICARVLYSTWGVRPRARFFRAIERALYNGLTKKHPQAPVVALNFVGQAAQSLFRDIRRGRARTAPPAVSDWAETVASQLIAVRMMRDDGTGDRMLPIEVYWRFLYDAATLVAVRREGLIPALREAYSPILPIPNGEDFVERNILFLNPLRGHQRWIFVKDFVYPLAAWLSLLVSMVALAPTLLK